MKFETQVRSQSTIILIRFWSKWHILGTPSLKVWGGVIFFSKTIPTILLKIAVINENITRSVMCIFFFFFLFQL